MQKWGKELFFLKISQSLSVFSFPIGGNGTQGSARSVFRCGKEIFPPCLTYLIQEALPDHILSTKLIVFGARNIFSGSHTGRCLIPFPFSCLCVGHRCHTRTIRVYFIKWISHLEVLLKSNVFILSDGSMRKFGCLRTAMLWVYINFIQMHIYLPS